MLTLAAARFDGRRVARPAKRARSRPQNVFEVDIEDSRRKGGAAYQ
jgi:hypothetical protein